jgi:hypothetical protein
MTWMAAKCYCEQMDMRLSSIETAEKLQCVANAQKSKFFFWVFRNGILENFFQTCHCKELFGQAGSL